MWVTEISIILFIIIVNSNSNLVLTLSLNLSTWVYAWPGQQLPICRCTLIHPRIPDDHSTEGRTVRLNTTLSAILKRLSRVACNMAPQRRLNHILSELASTLPSIGTLKLGDINYDVPASLFPSRLSHSGDLLDMRNAVNADNLHFLLQKYLLGQDVFLVSQPGPYARRLVLTFARWEYMLLDSELVLIFRE